MSDIKLNDAVVRISMFGMRGPWRVKSVSESAVIVDKGWPLSMEIEERERCEVVGRYVKRWFLFWRFVGDSSKINEESK